MERAVLALHNAFAYTYAEVAAILHIEEAEARRLAARVREHLHAGRPSLRPDSN